MAPPESPRKGPPFVNLLGYDTKGPKRFVAPGARDGTPFRVLAASDPEVVCFEGKVAGEAGMFTDFS